MDAVLLLVALILICDAIDRTPRRGGGGYQPMPRPTGEPPDFTVPPPGKSGLTKPPAV